MPSSKTVHAAIQEMLDHSKDASLQTWLYAQKPQAIDQSRANAACHLISVAISALAAAREIFSEVNAIDSTFCNERIKRQVQQVSHNTMVTKSWLQILDS